MRALNLENVEEYQEGGRVIAGGYVCRITQIEDEPQKEYLKIEYDIHEGEYKDHYSQLFTAKGFWAGKFIKSYKTTALPYFKAFVARVELSNQGYRFDDRNEHALRGKLVGLVLAEEEYQANDGSIKTRLYAAKIHTVQEIRNGEFIIPAIKKLDNSHTPSNSQKLSELQPVTADDLPF